MKYYLRKLNNVLVRASVHMLIRYHKGVNIAAAVGTWDAFANQSNQISHYGRIYGKKSSLFSLGPYETAIYKNSSFAMMPFMQDFTAKTSQ